jgi:hypothetical protein
MKDHAAANAEIRDCPNVLSPYREASSLSFLLIAIQSRPRLLISGRQLIAGRQGIVGAWQGKMAKGTKAEARDNPLFAVNCQRLVFPPGWKPIPHRFFRHGP